MVEGFKSLQPHELRQREQCGGRHRPAHSAFTRETETLLPSPAARLYLGTARNGKLQFGVRPDFLKDEEIIAGGAVPPHRPGSVL